MSAPENTTTQPPVPQLTMNFQDVRVAKPFNGSSKNVLQLTSFIQSLQILFVRYPKATDYDKIYLLAANLTDKALDWFYIYAQSHDVPNMTYDEFVRELTLAFSGALNNFDIIAKLTKITQRNNVYGYLREFQQYANLLGPNDVSQRTLVSLLANGLEERYRIELRYRCPTTLNDAIKAVTSLANSIRNDGGPALANIVAAASPTSSALSSHFPTDADGDVIMSIQHSPSHSHQRRGTHKKRTSNPRPTPSQSSSHSNSSNSSRYYRDLYRRTCMKNGLCFKCGEPGHQSANCSASNHAGQA